MKLYITFLLLLSFSYSNPKDSDIRLGIVYPERHDIKHFDPYLFNIDKNITNRNEREEAVNKLSVFMHETMSCNIDSKDRYNFIPFPEKDIKLSKNNTILTIQVKESETPWTFHNNNPVTIKDIYYSMLYSNYTNKGLPYLYKNRTTIELDNVKEIITITYPYSQMQANLPSHFKDLIILPHEHIKPFIDTNYNLESKEYDKLKNWIRKSNQNDLSHIIGAGPFKLSNIQHPTDQSTLLLLNEEHKRILNTLDAVKKVKIVRDEMKKQWFLRLSENQVNLVTDLLEYKQSSKSIVTQKAPSNKISSIFINHNKNLQLKNKSFRHALTFLINKDELIDQHLNGKAIQVSGPFHYNDTANDKNFKTLYNPDNFRDMMKNMGYEIETHPKANIDVYKNQETGEWAKFDFMYKNSKSDPISNQKICQNIIQIFRKNNILLNEDQVDNPTTYKKRISEGDFDLFYSIDKIITGQDIYNYYSKYGKNNYGKYIPSDDLRLAIDQLTKSNNTDAVAISKKEIFSILAKDYIHLYLWTPQSRFAYNRKYIKPINPKKHLQPNKFFYLPHRSWKMRIDD